MSIIPNRKYSLLVSAILCLAAIIVILTQGFNFGIDFNGGSLMEITVSDDVTKDQIESVFSEIEDSAERIGLPRIQEANIPGTDDSRFIVRTKELDETTHTELIGVLNTLPAFQELSFTSIGPVVGEDLKRKAVTSLIVAVVLIIFFVAYAFRKIPSHISSFRFGIIAVVTLIHDVLLTLGVFSLLGYEIDTFFITAMLTVLGFSVNDTIVVFDRVREAIIRKTHKNFADLAEYSVKSTIMRSINTSLTLLLPLLALFFFAGASIRTFILALIIGIAVGTYSSIFVATPLLVEWNSAQERKRQLLDEQDRQQEEERKEKKKQYRQKKKTVRR